MTHIHNGHWHPDCGDKCPTCGHVVDFDATPFRCSANIMSPAHCMAAYLQANGKEPPAFLAEASTGRWVNFHEVSE